jgi:hypothetical protein
MSVAAVAVVLFALVVLLVKTRALNAGSALVCVVLGLALGATSAGPVVNQGLTSGGSWIWAKVNAL